MLAVSCLAAHRTKLTRARAGRARQDGDELVSFPGLNAPAPAGASPTLWADAALLQGPGWGREAKRARPAPAAPPDERGARVGWPVQPGPPAYQPGWSTAAAPVHGYGQPPQPASLPQPSGTLLAADAQALGMAPPPAGGLASGPPPGFGHPMQHPMQHPGPHAAEAWWAPPPGPEHTAHCVHAPPAHAACPGAPGAPAGSYPSAHPAAGCAAPDAWPPQPGLPQAGPGQPWQPGQGQAPGHGPIPGQHSLWYQGPGVPPPW